jgi:hypothetical protein
MRLRGAEQSAHGIDATIRYPPLSGRSKPSENLAVLLARRFVGDLLRVRARRSGDAPSRPNETFGNSALLVWDAVVAGSLERAHVRRPSHSAV